MLHQMRLQSGPFERMRSGAKTLELRLFDEKRQKVGLGDEIEFINMEMPEKKLRTEVTGLLRQDTFADLIMSVPASDLGYKESDKEYLISSMYGVYAPEDEAKYGVLGIQVRLLQESS